MNISKTLDKYFTLDEILQDIPDTDTEELADIEETYQSYIEELNEELKTTDRVWLEFHAGLCASYGHTAKSLLYRIVKSSVGHPENSIAAANAVTILKVMEVFFNYVDLKGIIIPQADLSGAILDKANLSYADLTGVNLRNSSLNQTKMKKTVLKEVNLGVENFLPFQGILLGACCYSYETNTLFIKTNFSNKGYLWNIATKTFKKIELKGEIKQDTYFKKFTFIGNDRVAGLYRDPFANDGASLVYIIDFAQDQDVLKCNNNPIVLAENCITTIIQDCLITIEPLESYSSRISLMKFNRTKDVYELNYTLVLPYKIDKNSSSDLIFSPTQSFLALMAQDSFEKKMCIIFDYKKAEISCCIELENAFFEAAFSDDMQYLTLEQYSKLTVYRLSRSSIGTALTAEKVFEQGAININNFSTIQYVNNDKYLVFINKKGNELEILEFSEQKTFYYTTNFQIQEFYPIPALHKLLIYGHNAIQMVPLDEIINSPTNIVLGGNSSVNNRRHEMCIYVEEDTANNKLVEKLYVLSSRSRRIESYIINSNGLGPTNEIINLKVDGNDFYQKLDFSQNTLYIEISTVLLENKSVKKTGIFSELIKKKVELYSRSNGEHYHTFPGIYYCFKLSSDGEYALCITEHTEIQIWHLPSKKVVYEVEKYPFEEFIGVTAINKSYIVLGHEKYIRILSLHDKLTLYSKESFSDSHVYRTCDDSTDPQYFSKSLKPLFYNETTLIFHGKTKIYICDLDTSSNDRSFDVTEFGDIYQFDISNRQGLLMVHFKSNKKNIVNAATIALFDINTGNLLDSIGYTAFLTKIRFSTDGSSLVGYNSDQTYIWNVRNGKLWLKYRNPAVFEACGLDIIEAEVDDVSKINFENYGAIKNKL